MLKPKIIRLCPLCQTNLDFGYEEHEAREDPYLEVPLRSLLKLEDPLEFVKKNCILNSNQLEELGYYKM